jgi:hypothetical protein
MGTALGLHLFLLFCSLFLEMTDFCQKGVWDRLFLFFGGGDVPYCVPLCPCKKGKWELPFGVPMSREHGGAPYHWECVPV